MANSLLRRINPEHAYGGDSIDTELSRWSSVKREDYKGNPYPGLFTPLTLVDEFRCLVAAIYGKSIVNNEKTTHGSPTASDVAQRCAYYGNADLDLKSMKAGHQKDDNVFTFAALYNLHVLSEKKLRQRLEHYLQGFGRHGLIQLYQKRCSQIHEAFRFFNPQPVSEWLRDEDDHLTDGDTNTSEVRIVRQLAKLDRKLNVVSQILTSAVVIAAFVAVFYAVFSSFDRWLGSGWAWAAAALAGGCASIAAGLAQRYVDRLPDKGSPR